MSNVPSPDQEVRIGISDPKRTHREDNVRKRYAELVFHNQEYQNAHNSYENELREMECIENGTPEKLKACWDNASRQVSAPSVSFGTLADNWLRNVKNLCLSVIILSSRAAIRGGMLPEAAFCLCDCYSQEIESCNDIPQLADLTLRAEVHFAELVRDVKNGVPLSGKSLGSPHISRCKNYIFAHLHEKLTVQDIADALHLNPNYLSDLFKQHEGQSILQYILCEKIKLVQNMLTYSEYTYSEIASYLGFASQSHMGTHFKKITGMTLREYRNQYHISNAPFSDS
ncbi:MAG: AraC family transcriptional regulator [Eubacteriales bacterium]|nr:AraC family transcriptional regulator [Eubacteriales bacterium]